MIKADGIIAWQQIHDAVQFPYTGRGDRTGNLFPSAAADVCYTGTLILGGINSRHDGEGKIMAEPGVRDLNGLLNIFQKLSGRPAHMTLTHQSPPYPMSDVDRALWLKYLASNSMFVPETPFIGRQPDFLSFPDQALMSNVYIVTYPGQDEEYFAYQAHTTNSDLDYISDDAISIAESHVLPYIDAGVPLTIMTASFGGSITNQIEHYCEKTLRNRVPKMDEDEIEKKLATVTRISVSSNGNILLPEDRKRFKSIYVQFGNDRTPELFGNKDYLRLIPERMQGKDTEELLREGVFVISIISKNCFVLTGIAKGEYDTHDHNGVPYHTTGVKGYPHTIKDVLDPNSMASPGLKALYEQMVFHATNRPTCKFDHIGFLANDLPYAMKMTHQEMYNIGYALYTAEFHTSEGIRIPGIQYGGDVNDLLVEPSPLPRLSKGPGSATFRYLYKQSLTRGS